MKTKTKEQLKSVVDHLTWPQLKRLAYINGIKDKEWRLNATRSQILYEIEIVGPEGIDLSTVISPDKLEELNSEHEAEAKQEERLPIASCTVEGLIEPKIDSEFIISEKLSTLFEALSSFAHTPKIPNVLMVGPQGCGKTETPIQYAARMNIPVLKINCALVREPRDWFGYKTAESGSVRWIKSQFAQAVEQGGVVILLDEITRVSPPVLNSLFPLLDQTRESFIEEVKEVLKVGPNVFFFATANIGTKFTGTFGKIDSALMDRFAIRITSTYLPRESEIKVLINKTKIPKEVAKSLVEVANKVRGQADSGTLSETISTRTLIDTAILFKKMGPPAFDFTIIPLFPNISGSSEQVQVRQIIQSQFGGY